MHKTYVIGDIHSGLRALKQVLDIVPKASDNLYVFLGVYVDGWSEAPETVEFIIDFSEKNHCILL